MCRSGEASGQWIRQPGQPAWVMGVLNCTPDSFSDGGQFIDVDAAVQHGLRMWRDGASIIDVGGESTRPGAKSVAVDEELQRVLPVIQKLVACGCSVSIDTRKAEVMAQAVQAGVCMINDVTALTFDARSLLVAAESKTDICLMHMQGKPETMQDRPQYNDVMAEVISYFEKRIEACMQAGIASSSLILDPGIGFGKRLEDNLHLIMHLDVLKQYFKLPVLLGVSRKSFIGLVTGVDVDDRELETAVVDSLGVFLGADGVRVHDVSQQRRACIMASTLADARL